MSKYLNKPIGYLEIDDFDSKGNLINSQIPKNIPVVIMAQASWCPHCTTSKPAFQEFADDNEGHVFCGTIQADGDRESEKALGKLIGKFKPGFKGFPDYLLYKGGKRVNKEIKGRSAKDLVEFAGI
jgi:thiol-disulfide isomerase/thioredoxin